MTRSLLAVVAVAILAGGSAAAHHSYAAFHLDQIIEIEGVLEDFEYVYPHSLLKVRTSAALYTGEWAGPRVLQRSGIQSDTLKKGDRVILTGNPRRDIVESGILNVKSVRRPSDGWSWGAGVRPNR
jgi:hypothetical protein